jgi:hypothetical protein
MKIPYEPIRHEREIIAGMFGFTIGFIVGMAVISVMVQP